MPARTRRDRAGVAALAPRTRRDRAGVAALTCGCIGAAAYINGLHGDWLDDDPKAITENPDVPCPAGVSGLFERPSLWQHDFWGEPMASPASHLSYRPLTILAFRLQHALVGFDGVSFHAVNVALHASVVVLLHAVTAPPVLPRRSQRSFATLLFALHAVHVEVVTNTVGRAELLSAILFLASILVYLPLPLLRDVAHADGGRGRRWRLLAAVARILAAAALAGLAMLCKEVGITALLVCASVDVALAIGRGACRRSGAADARLAQPLSVALRVLLLALCSAGLVVGRLHINGWRAPIFSPADNPAAFCESRLCRCLSYSHLYWLNLRLLLLPDNLAHDWSTTTVPNLQDASDARLPYALLPYALVLAVLLAALVALRRRRTSLFIGLACGLSLLVLPFLPAAHVFVTVGFTVAERVLYLPSAGFCLLLARLWPARGASKRAGGGGGGGGGLGRAACRALGALLRHLVPLCVFTLHGVLAMRRNVDWRTNEALLYSGVAHQPTNAKLQYNLGFVLYQHARPPRLDEARSHLQAARRLQPSFTEAACVEASLLRERNELEEAVSLLRRAISIAGTDGSHALYFAYRGLAETLDAANRPAEALRAFAPAIQLNPTDLKLAYQGARAARAAREGGAQQLLLKHVLQLSPMHGAARADLAALGAAAAEEAVQAQAAAQAAGDTATIRVAASVGSDTPGLNTEAAPANGRAGTPSWSRRIKQAR